MLATLNATLEGMMGPLGPLITLGGIGALLLVAALLMLPKPRKDPLTRLQESQAPAQADKRARQMRRDPGSRHGKKLEKYAAFLEPSNDKEMSDARLKMIQAGYHGKTAVRDFHAVQFILGLGGLAISVVTVLVVLDYEEMSSIMLGALVMGPALLGYYGPKLWVDNRRSARQEEIVSGFPDALDMLLICVEAGQSLDQSIRRVSSEIGRGYPALGEELDTVSNEIKAGKDRTEVLKDMGWRCGVDDINSFVTVMVQSATFGTSIGDALRVFSDEMRDKRIMKAEEKANVLPTKLTLGTMLFTVPPLLIILIGPSVLGISQVLGSGSFGG